MSCHLPDYTFDRLLDILKDNHVEIAAVFINTYPFSTTTNYCFKSVNDVKVYNSTSTWMPNKYRHWMGRNHSVPYTNGPIITTSYQKFKRFVPAEAVYSLKLTIWQKNW